MSAQPERNLLLIGVGSALALSSLIGGAAQLGLGHSSRRAAIADLTARIKSWWVMAVLLAAAFLGGDLAVVVLFAFVSMASLREFISVTRSRPADRPALLAAFFLVLPTQYYLVWRGWYGLFAIFIPVYVFLALPMLATLAADARDFLTRAAETQWALMTCVYCVSYVPALLNLHLPGQRVLGPGVDASVNRSAGLAVFMIVVTESSDIMQYVFGKVFGRRPIVPALSPSKTLEGFLGGIACATGMGAGLWWITPCTPWQSAALALLIALLGFLGGVVMSAIKRDRGIKDWSQLIPGHGGMIDRVDSLCFAAPVFYHVARYCFC